MATREYSIQFISPMSAFRTGFALSIIGLFAWLVCSAFLYFGLKAAGVWGQFNDVIGGVGGEQSITFGVVMSMSLLVGAIFAIISSCLAPLMAIVYNAVVDLFGGIRVTLRQEVE
ncbi:MAG: DUF3566 domain-containing protein [Corynebacterium sp.]|uniref:DUF3566 domain-containing protein n=1 Tax=Corynebacterium mustelae TaxID=571915 RepID=A0A0G3GZV5_9CORY|nr:MULTISPECIES: DUF3566 domain-containing protein [Corynebacterium]AKK04377.1 Transmembrane domain of unknown function (DUF3566) [Corynebacterium mustelae]MDO5098610.1 DUF3566 domain-containing protein [Corynebacterium sp.]